MPAPLAIHFDAGSLVVSGAQASPTATCLPDAFVWDPRVQAWRALALHYRPLIAKLTRLSLPFDDHARTYQPTPWHHRARLSPFPHQEQAIDAWEAHGRCGLVVLPTGAGKTFVAELAIARVGRPTLVVTPTLDLMHQWYECLFAAFGQEPGLIGGGYYEVSDLAVTTYDSAYLHMERFGNRYAFIVFDEAHHLPSTSYALAAQHAIAPFRLGLTATPERSDGGESLYDTLIGPQVYTKTIKALAGTHLATYDTTQVEVDLDADERETYARERGIYTAFVRARAIRMSSPDGWTTFLKACATSKEGRRALLAYRAYRRIAQCCRAKMDYLALLLRRHQQDRLMVFTHDNETVYAISRRFLLPAITHQTPIKERKSILAAFNTGTYPAIVTGRVLNEGVNVPAANVAVVMSGSGSVREHVQRLGRILRPRTGKHALLYELVARDTAEEFVSERRREHDAYR